MCWSSLSSSPPIPDSPPPPARVDLTTSLSLSLSNSFLPEKKSKLIQFEPWAIEEITIFGILFPVFPGEGANFQIWRFFQPSPKRAREGKGGGNLSFVSHLLKWRNGGGGGAQGCNHDSFKSWEEEELGGRGLS